MNPTKVIPSLGAKAFSCPHCNALAHQSWFVCQAEAMTQEPPRLVSEEEAEESRQLQASIEMIKYFEALATHLPFMSKSFRNCSVRKVENVWLSKCFSCNNLAIWVGGVFVFPDFSPAFEPNDDLEADIKQDFREAASIVNKSPRGAAALLRLCVQKICKQLGLPGKNIDSDIATLVTRGLDIQIQQALDVVRVVGNEAVHPGTIDFRDDPTMVTQLFQLINIIADAMISQPARIKELYSSLPQAKREAIEKRDKPVS
jgi:hypothetical protein